MEFSKVLICCCLATLLLMDVMDGSPVRVNARDVAEAERLELAIEEGLAIYRAERRKRRRHRRRVNGFIERMRICRNYHHYPRHHWPAFCQNLSRSNGQRETDDDRTIMVIIEK